MRSDVMILLIHRYDSSLPIAVCDTFCLGDEDKYTDCVYTICGDSFTCQHIEDVGIKCGKYNITVAHTSMSN